uniref:Uncharacterized protein n=1 Tax=viral metagenome TaxID=1070528 RepID=A0A6C0KW00_9ZZZZ
MSGDQQVQREKDNVMYGFYEFNDVPRQFKSSQDYLAYKKGLLSNKKSPNVIASGDKAPTMSLSGARDISNTFVYDGVDAAALDAGYARLTITMDFNFYGVNYGKWQNGGVYWAANNILSFGEGYSNTRDISGGLAGIYLGTADRVISSVYVVDTVKQGNFNIFKLIVNYYNYTEPAGPGEAETGSFELRLVKEASGFFRQWIEVKTNQAYNLDGQGDRAFWNIVFDSPDSGPEKNGPQYTFGTFFTNLDRSSFVLASDPTGTTWKLFDHAHLTI